MPHDPFDALGALIQEWQNGLTLETINFCKAYVEGKGNIVLVARSLSGQDYRLIVRRLPNRHVKTDGPGRSCLKDRPAYPSCGVDHWDEAMVYLLPPEFVHCPKEFTVASFVWLRVGR